MKPKFRSFLSKAFPSLIIVPAMMQVAVAAPLNTAANGSIIVTSADNGANRIEANGGATPLVTIGAGTVLTADGSSSAVEVNVAGYNDSSYAGLFTLGSPGDLPTLTITPAAPVTGIINAGNLSAGDDGVEGSNFAVTVLNTGTIIGANSGTSQIGNGSFFANTGTWSATNGSGISAFTASGVTVHNTGTISAASAGLQGGVTLGATGLIVNSGTISATGNFTIGAALGNNGVVYNLAGGSISGGATGITGSGITGGITLYNWGTVSGGIAAISGSALAADSINLNYGSIINGGIATLGGADVINLNADYFGDVTVNGSIAGGAGVDTINLTADSLDPVFGFSFANGNVFVDGDIDGGAGVDTINLTTSNSGTIYVSGELDGSGGDDIFNLVSNSGALVVGSIDGGGNADSINLTSTGGALVVLEGIDGDSGTDTLTISGGLTSLIDFSGDTTIQDFIESANGSGLTLILEQVVGIETLTKNDAGLALISGYNSTDNVFDSSAIVEADNIAVNSGALYINGSLESTSGGRSAVTVNAGALGGTGTWNADVNVISGGISAGQVPVNLDWNTADSSSDTGSTTPVIDPVGTLTINGSLTLGSGAFIRQDLKTQQNSSVIVGGDGSDLIIHNTDGGGVVTLDPNSAVRLSPLNLNQAVSDGDVTIIDSDSAINGTPGTVTVQVNGNIQDNSIFRGSLVPFLSGTQTANLSGTNLAAFTTLAVVNDGSGQSLVAFVQHDYAGLAGLTANQSAIGAAIDNLVSSPNALVQDFIGALDLSSSQVAVETIASLSPEAQISQALALVNSNYRINRLVQNHLSDVRSSDTVRIPVGAPSAKAEVAPTPASSNRGNVWGAVSYDKQDYEGDESGSDYDGDVTAFTAGVDYRVAPQLVLGVLLDGSTADYDYNSGGDSDVDSLRFTAYGTWGAATGLYSDFLVGYGSHDLDFHRPYGGILGGSASGSTDASSIQALWTVGYSIVSQNVKHGPFAGLEYQKVDVDGYDENGILPIGVDSYDVDSLRGLIGYRAEATFGRFSPYVTVAYAHEFKDDEVETKSNIAGSPFTIRTAGLGSSIVVTTGVGITLNPSLSLNVGYRGDISVESDGVTSNGGTLGLNWAF